MVKALNSTEEGVVKSALGGASLLASSVARLYKAVDGAWDYTKKWGGVALVKDGAGHFLKLVNLENSSVEFTQELYEGFEYKSAKPFFHVFEGDDAVYAFSFTNDSDAIVFRTAVQENIPSGGGSTASTRQAPPPVPATRLSPPPSARSPAPLSPRDTMASDDSGHHTPHDSASSASESEGGASALGASAHEMKKDDSKKKSAGGGGFLSTMKRKMLGEKVPDVEISKPRDFRHMSSIGWTPEAGFEIRNIPPEWRKLFQQAGVKKSELKDAETAGFIMDIIQKEGGLDALNASNKDSGGGGGGADEEKPSAAPIAPPMPPAPPVSAPKPPPPPTGTLSRSTTAGAPRGGLLDQIKQGKELKNVDTVEHVSKPVEPPPPNLADTLAKAMAARRGAVADAPSKVNILADDDDNDDGWD